MPHPIYLDYNATTPLDPEVAHIVSDFNLQNFGNASSIHSYGRKVRGVIDLSRDRLSQLLGCKPGEIIFTSGGTESDNLAIIGLAQAHKEKGKHLITSQIEHHAVLHAFEYLEKQYGYEVTYLKPDGKGILSLESLQKHLREDTTLVSIMSANNETGSLQPIREIAEHCHEKNILFHCDMIQTAGKRTIDLKIFPATAISLSGHKFYGPAGVGALILRHGIPLETLFHGGSHENLRRPGTENPGAILGMVEAYERCLGNIVEENQRQQKLIEALWQGISGSCDGVHLNTPLDQSLGNTLNISVDGVHGEELLLGLDLEGLCVSSGSACMVGTIQASHVLLAMDKTLEQASTAVRFSIGKSTDEEDIPEVVSRFINVVERQKN